MFDQLELINYLRFIPTGDNAQPFRYQADENSITVFHIDELAKHRFNQKNTASLLSLGMIKHVIDLFANKKGLVCSYSIPEHFSDHSPWLECHFTKPETQCKFRLQDKESPINYLFERYTDRGAYPSDTFDLRPLQEKYNGFIAFKSQLTPVAYKSISRFETMIFDDLQAFKDIEKWLRYSKDEILKTNTGMSLKNIGLDFLNGLLFKLFKSETIANAFLSPYFKFLTKIKVKVIYPKSSGFGLCYVKDSSNKEIIVMGEKIMNLWLDITAQGYTLQPISSPTLLTYIYRNREGEFDKNYDLDLNSANKIFNEEFKIDGEIIWMFRFGRATSAKINNRTMRLPIDQNLIIKEKKVA
jgi:hypothetical protein